MKFTALCGKRGKITPKRRDCGSRQVAGCTLLSLLPANSLKTGGIGLARARILRRQVESDSISVVVPVYNEEENIAALLQQLQAALKEWPGEVEFLIVDDGSTDATLELLKHAQTGDSRT